MEYRVSEDFEQKKAVVSNNHGFISTYLDGGFKEKWNGYWSPSHKYLDYFGIKVNGVWLNIENLEEATYSDKIVYRHKLSSLKVKQEISAPENLPGFKLQITIENNTENQKAVKASIETGIDIRPRAEDIGSSDYSLESSNTGLKAIKGEKWISISSDKFNFSGHSYIKDHYPGERQECLVLDEISCQCELNPRDKDSAEVVFKTDDREEGAIEHPKGSFRQPETGRTFNYSLESMENLFYTKNGSGVIAGHPWFQNYWARDSFWTALGMVDAGMFNSVEKILLNFGERENFPSKILTEGGSETKYPRSDSIPLFAIAVDKLDRYYDTDERLRRRAEQLLKENRPKGKIVENHPDGTWMDTLEREKAVDIQSLWIEALERFDKGTKRLRKGLKRFKTDNYMKDNLENDFESINPSIPLMFGHIGQEKAGDYLEKINGEFSSRFGARTRSVTDPGYNPSGYHTGSAWALTTCWAAAANLNYGQTDHGINFLKKLSQFIDRNQLGALPELVNSENGDSLGCDEQAWSAGLFVHVVDSYLLGINFENGKVIVDPVNGFSGTRYSKKIMEEDLDLKVNNGQAEVLNEPDLDIKIR